MKTTAENNRAIAEFMGWKITPGVFNDDAHWSNSENEMVGNKFSTDLDFHYKWDWLMPVVERIESMGYGWSISAKSFRIWSETDEESIETNRDTTMKAVYDGVSEFINQLKTEK